MKNIMNAVKGMFPAFGKIPRRGSFLVLTAVGTMLAVGLSALVTDVGWLYYNKARIQTAVDAGWKAGMDRAVELGGLPLSDANKALVVARAQEVVQLNWPDPLVASVTFSADGTSFTVAALPPVGLMFARVINVNSANVSGSRGSGYTAGEGIIPLAIPWGITKDIDPNTYSVSYFATNSTPVGFETNQQYVLKLGGSSSATQTANVVKLLLVPMDSTTGGTDAYSDGQASDLKYELAYGVAYWCLRIIKVNDTDDATDSGYWFPDLPGVDAGANVAGHEGIEWLLGFKGGAFLLPYDDGNMSNRHYYPEIKAKLDALGLRYDIITGFDSSSLSITTLYQNINTADATILKIDRPRPRIAVYSSQTDSDAVELALQDAQIPYGTHPQVRTGTFAAASCNHIYDRDILNGELQRASTAGDPVYTWLHTHHEDFTGFNGGCDRFDRSCYDWDDGSNFPTKVYTIAKGASTSTELCNYCRDYYFGPAVPGGTASPGWGWEFDVTTCYRRAMTSGWDSCMAFNAKVPMNKTSSGNTDLCGYCATKFNFSTQVWLSGYATNSCYIHSRNPITCLTWDTDRTVCPTPLRKGTPTEYAANATASTDLCPKCRVWYYYSTPTSAAGWNYTDSYQPKKKDGYVEASCKNWGIRCGDKITASGTFWHDLSSYTTKMCRGMSDAYPQCRAAKDNWNIAASFSYTDDASYTVMPSKLLDANGGIISKDNSRPLPADSNAVLHPNRVQKMKWKVSELILKHVQDGGFFYSQCFAPETLGMALWQRRIWLDQLTGGGAVGDAAYADVMGFKSFNNYAFPWGYYKNSTSISSPNNGVSPTYSTINGSMNSTFPLNDDFDARCQDHGGDPSGGTGYTDCFYTPTVKTTVGSETFVVLGSYDTDHPEYVKGEKPGNSGGALGQYCFLGGHYLSNIQSKRLVLNNVLLGALAEKTAGYATSIRTKYNYGAVDPDNVQGGGTGQYQSYFTNGYNNPINLSDRITPLSGNMATETEEVIALRLASGGQIVIVPITDVGQEVWNNSAQNNGAQSIYDLAGQNGDLAGVHIYDPVAANAGQFTSVVRVIGFAEFMIVPAGQAYASNTTVIGDYQSGQVRGVFLRYIVKPYTDYTPPN